MDANWVDTQNNESTAAYLADVHHLAEYIIEQQNQGKNSSYKDEYVKIILREDEKAQDNPLFVNYQLLATAIWVFLFKEDEMRNALDKKYGKKFCKWLDRMDPFSPKVSNRYLDQTFELPTGDYVITDPFYIDPSNTQLLGDWLRDAMPSLHMHDTLSGNWECILFKTPADKTFNDLKPAERLESAYGRFNAESSMVCVVSLRDAAAHNPNFAEKLERGVADNPLSYRHATLIRNFKGTCKFEIKETFYKHERKNIPNGYALNIIFEGIDVKADEPVRYESHQMPACYPYVKLN